MATRTPDTALREYTFTVDGKAFTVQLRVDFDAIVSPRNVRRALRNKTKRTAHMHGAVVIEVKA